MAINVQATIGEMVTDKPSRARVCDRLGIGFCCGGQLTLDMACKQRGLVMAEHEHSGETRDD